MRMGQSATGERSANRGPLTRRSALGSALAGLVALPAASPATAASNVLIVYVYADDCAPCQIFAAQDWPQFLASPVSKSVKFIKTHAPKTTQAYQAKYWPPEARPYHSAV